MPPLSALHLFSSILCPHSAILVPVHSCGPAVAFTQSLWCALLWFLLRHKVAGLMSGLGLIWMQEVTASFFSITTSDMPVNSPCPWLRRLCRRAFMILWSLSDIGESSLCSIPASSPDLGCGGEMGGLISLLPLPVEAPLGLEDQC